MIPVIAGFIAVFVVLFIVAVGVSSCVIGEMDAADRSELP